MSYYKIYENDVLQHDFIPVMKGSTRYSTTPAPSNCLWDAVDEAYFENSGLDAFGVNILGTNTFIFHSDAVPHGNNAMFATSLYKANDLRIYVPDDKLNVYRTANAVRWKRTASSTTFSRIKQSRRSGTKPGNCPSRSMKTSKRLP